VNYVLNERPRKKSKPPSLLMRVRYDWWALADLNRGPKDYESSALTN
jgi:hypothetical protein